MAGPFYVDLANPGAWNGRAGTDSGSPWLGISGLQKAFDAVVAGEICYVLGEGALNKFYSVPCDAISGNFTDGEAVSWSGGTGVVHVPATTASPVELELLTGSICTNDQTVTGSTSSNTFDVNGSATLKTINIDTNSGTYNGGYIKFIGVSAFSPLAYATRAIINGNSASGSDGFTFGSVNTLWFENIEIKNLAGTNKTAWLYGTGGGANCVMVNCSGNGCTGYGISAYSGNFGLIYRCVFYSNLAGGMYGGTNYFCCASYNNSAYGFYVTHGGRASNCIFHNNTTYGATTPSNTNQGFILENCVFDSNGSHGVYINAQSNATPGRLIACRITNQSGTGDIGADFSSRICLGIHNVFDTNKDHIANSSLYYSIEADEENNEDGGGGGDTNQGYAQAVANDNFATGYTSGTDPSKRRVSIVIPWT